MNATQSVAARSVSARYVELDSMRGLAAVAVVFYHLVIGYSIRVPVLLYPFFSGHESVILFFVLSGFVLSLPFWTKGTNSSYGQYLVRRFFRIYVPFAAALVFAAFIARPFIHSRLNISAWFNVIWQDDLTPRFILSQLLMPRVSRLNTAFWSLRFEMQISIVFPFLLLLLRRLGTVGSLVLSAAAYYLATRFDPIWNFDNLLDTVIYGSLFVLGAILASQRHAVRDAFLRMPKVLRTLVIGAGAWTYFYGGRICDLAHRGYYGDYVTALGACVVIAAALSVPAMSRVLQHKFATYLGRVSYSMYLVHGTVLWAVLNLFYGRTSVWWQFAVILLGVAVCSHVFCMLVEEPSLRFGKQLTGRLRERATIGASAFAES